MQIRPEKRWNHGMSDENPLTRPLNLTPRQIGCSRGRYRGFRDLIRGFVIVCCLIASLAVAWLGFIWLTTVSYSWVRGQMQGAMTPAQAKSYSVSFIYGIAACFVGGIAYWIADSRQRILSADRTARKRIDDDRTESV